MRKIIFLVVLFLAIGGYMIKTGLDLSVGDKDDQKTFAYEFGKWVLSVGGNVKDLTGHAIKQDWLPDAKVNESNNTDAGIED